MLGRSALVLAMSLAVSTVAPAPASAVPTPPSSPGDEAAPAVGDPVTVTFEFTGVRQPWVVPADVCSVMVKAFGAKGAAGANPDGPTAPGGKGGQAEATIAVTAGEILGIYVGGQGLGRLGGFNGGGDGGDGDEEDGGGGGGASDVRRGFDLEDRLVVAGGGGGGGADPDEANGSSVGGDGGGVSGRPGRDSDSDPATPGGEGGTQFAGGTAPRTFDPLAESGSLGQGGKGGLGHSIDDTGGGGGGGYYGGGGGAGENDDVESDGGGGGGGGSGYPADAFFEIGAREGNGLVEITYTAGAECIEFDWTMPDRFGADENGDGLVDYFEPTGAKEIEPDGWRVDFEQTEPAGCDTSLRRTWFIDDTEVDISDPNIIEYSPLSCDFSYRFTEEAVYQVKLVLKDLDDNEVGSAQHEVTVQDWLIVSIGDSIASGEGNPDLTMAQADGDAVWQHRKCHRSANAGSAVAAMAVEQQDPRTSVTFVHLACSGAQITEGLLEGYAGIEPGGGPPLRSQIEQIRNLIPNREIDAVLVSIGANDVRFSEVAEACVKKADCPVKPGAGLLFESRITQLPGRFEQLNARLTGSAGLPEVASRRFLFTEYHDVTRFDDTSLCGSEGTEEVLYDQPWPFVGISETEAEWASNVMTVRLNNAVQAAAFNYGWSWIGNIRQLFLFHGYCADDTWIIRYQQSFAKQDDVNGTLHPNINGHLVYGGVIKERLTIEFYASGDLDQPRRPAE